jgi:hypothetical protein
MGGETPHLKPPITPLGPGEVEVPRIAHERQVCAERPILPVLVDFPTQPLDALRRVCVVDAVRLRRPVDAPRRLERGTGSASSTQGRGGAESRIWQAPWPY